MKLAIAPTLSLPLDAVTKTFAILGMTGSGKSNTAVVMAEEMFRAKLHWVAIDPKGDWWGIRAQGTGPGLPIVIFGGQHGDLPLEPTAGAFVAETVIDHALTCVLDLSEFTEGEKIRFMAGVGGQDGFAARFYRRKSPTQSPTHIFFEEADDILPQKAMRDKAKLLHDCSRLALWGRQRGIGATLITQRSARLHKDVLTQALSLIVFRTTGPQDRKAILDWVRYHQQEAELVESLPLLKNGEGWLWSPEWLQKMERLDFSRRTTFDSGATPLQGTHKRSPATLADVNLGDIRDKMAETIERAKENDPRELHKIIADLRKQLAAKKPKAETKVVEVPVLGKKELQELKEFCRKHDAMTALVERVRSVLHNTPARGLGTQGPGPPVGANNTPARGLRTPGHERQLDMKPPVDTRGDDGQRTVFDVGNGRLPRGEATVLAVLLQYPEGLQRDQLSVLAGYKTSSRNTYLQRLGEREYIEWHGQTVMATKAGAAAMPNVQTLPRGEELQQHWLRRLPRGDGVVLRVLIEAHPNALTREEISALTNYKPSSRNTYLQRLSARRLIEDGPGGIRASATLFG